MIYLKRLCVVVLWLPALASIVPWMLYHYLRYGTVPLETPPDKLEQWAR